MKSKKVLNSFIKYCEKNPDLRFWQALRNWSKYEFILGATKNNKKIKSDNIQEMYDLEDTFYIK